MHVRHLPPFWVAAHALSTVGTSAALQNFWSEFHTVADHLWGFILLQWSGSKSEAVFMTRVCRELNRLLSLAL